MNLPLLLPENIIQYVGFTAFPIFVSFYSDMK